GCEEIGVGDESEGEDSVQQRAQLATLEKLVEEDDHLRVTGGAHLVGSQFLLAQRRVVVDLAVVDHLELVGGPRKRLHTGEIDDSQSLVAQDVTGLRVDVGAMEVGTTVRLATRVFLSEIQREFVGAARLVADSEDAAHVAERCEREGE
ncbi:hypothetical protein PMAYCL1PPCAC_25374, partial [Pristionchus mayeri]